jgi:two-component system cell cycle sensor histidine kinase/response regulator CckA
VPEQIYLLGNLSIMVSYAAIMVAIVVPVARAGQVRTNHLAMATALIFFSCSVGHGLHGVLTWRTLTGSTTGGHAMLSGWAWAIALWDLFTAMVGIYYWTLRRGYGVLLGKGAIYVGPDEKYRLDQADARERAARDVAEQHRATLAAVVEHTDTAIIGVSLSGVVTAWNRGAERLFGYRADEVVGRTVAMLADENGSGRVNPAGRTRPSGSTGTGRRWRC